LCVIGIKVKANWSSFKDIAKRSGVKSKQKRTKNRTLGNASMKV